MKSLSISEFFNLLNFDGTKFKFIALVMAMLLIESCATIISGSKQEFLINSEPSSADIYINDMYVGKTPMNFLLARKNAHTITIVLEGYHDYKLNLKKEFNGWFLGNLIFGGIIGIVVDAATGSMYKLSPAQVNPYLTRKEEEFFGRHTTGEIFITFTNDLKNSGFSNAELQFISQLTKKN
jgi:hypothetical protein